MEQTDQALKTVIMVGRTEVGKTTLANTLMYGSPEARKTQSIGRIGSIIDTPGEFVENPIYYRAILLNAYDADIVLKRMKRKVFFRRTLPLLLIEKLSGLLRRWT